MNGGQQLAHVKACNKVLRSDLKEAIAALETAHAALCRLSEDDIGQIEAMPAIELAATVLEKYSIRISTN